MKRFAASIGLVMALLPASAAAAESEICNALKGVDPVSSHYVGKVLERAEEGLKNVRSASANAGFERYLPSWARQIGEATNSLIDSYLTISVAQTDLLNATACLRVDSILIDCKLKEVHDELQDQLKKNSIWGIIQAEALLEFLRERKVHLVRGALNPNYQDPTWEEQWRFDKKGSSSSAPPAIGGGSSSASSKAMCPFDSDYAPPGGDGYGCDGSLLQKISAYKPAEAERKGWETLKQELDKYKQLGREFAELERELNGLHGNASSAASIPQGTENPEHKELSGCQEEAPPDTLRLRSVRSPFSYKKDEIRILSDFVAKRAAEGIFREHSDDLKTPDEIKDKEKRERAENANNPLIQLFRNSARQFFESLNELQGKKEGIMFASAPDGTLEIADALKDLRASVGELSRIATQKEGLRSFVIRYAYYLRRTCIYRPCNDSLERILRTAYADECFPYTDGQFLQDNANDPRWKKCAEAACIQVEGADLPARCEDILPKK